MEQAITSKELPKSKEAPVAAATESTPTFYIKDSLHLKIVFWSLISFIFLTILVLAYTRYYDVSSTNDEALNTAAINLILPAKELLLLGDRSAIANFEEIVNSYIDLDIIEKAEIKDLQRVTLAEAGYTSSCDTVRVVLKDYSIDKPEVFLENIDAPSSELIGHLTLCKSNVHLYKSMLTSLIVVLLAAIALLSIGFYISSILDRRVFSQLNILTEFCKGALNDPIQSQQDVYVDPAFIKLTNCIKRLSSYLEGEKEGHLQGIKELEALAKDDEGKISSSCSKISEIVHGLEARLKQASAETPLTDELRGYCLGNIDKLINIITYGLSDKSYINLVAVKEFLTDIGGQIYKSENNKIPINPIFSSLEGGISINLNDFKELLVSLIHCYSKTSYGSPIVMVSFAKPKGDNLPIIIDLLPENNEFNMLWSKDLDSLLENLKESSLLDITQLSYTLSTNRNPTISCRISAFYISDIEH